MSTAVSDTAHASLRESADGALLVVIGGNWLARRKLPGLQAVEERIGRSGVRVVSFDTAQLEGWNSALMTRIVRLRDRCESAQVKFDESGLPGGLQRLLALSRAVPEKKDAARRAVQTGVFERIGGAGIRSWNGFLATLTFMGASVLALLKLVRGKAQFRWSDTFLVMQQCGPEALAIVALINFLIGLILAFVGATELARFGASIYTADLVAVATVREMACIMTGIILCGRTGAAFAAQLGTMKVNQEIEAFETFGIDPVEFLVLPRMLALILMMPLLCVFADLIAISGGFMVSTLAMGVSPQVYLNRTLESIQLGSFLLGIGKGAFFGVLVALSGCMRGMQCGTNAAAVGQATTSAVVTGITWIIASDGLFAVLCNALGI